MIVDEFNWVIFLCQLCSGLSSTLIMQYALTCIFPPKRPFIFWVVQIAIAVGVIMQKQSLDPVLIAIIGVILPLACETILLKGQTLIILIVGIFDQVVQFVMELPFALLWVFITGSPAMDAQAMLQHVPVYVVIIVTHTIAMAIAAYVLYRVCKRVLDGQDWANAGYRKALKGWVFICFGCIQVGMVLCFLAISFGVSGRDASIMLICLALSTLFIAVDLFMFWEMRRFVDKQFADLRGESISTTADGYLQRAQGMQAELRSAAVLRHDLRNHMQVIVSLCERGERKQAQAYLEDAREEMPL